MNGEAKGPEAEQPSSPLAQHLCTPLHPFDILPTARRVRQSRYQSTIALYNRYLVDVGERTVIRTGGYIDIFILGDGEPDEDQVQVASSQVSLAPGSPKAEKFKPSRKAKEVKNHNSPNGNSRFAAIDGPKGDTRTSSASTGLTSRISYLGVANEHLCIRSAAMHS